MLGGLFGTVKLSWLPLVYRSFRIQEVGETWSRSVRCRLYRIEGKMGVSSRGFRLPMPQHLPDDIQALPTGYRNASESVSQVVEAEV
jgi:hypothetical protein